MEWLTEWINPAATVLALVVGFCIKAATKNDNITRFIPTICAVVGIVVVVIADYTAGTLTVYSVVIGAMSGLAATGLFEMVKNWIDNNTPIKAGGSE